MNYIEMYECDPSKNTTCKKSMCHLMPGCYWTEHKEYAKDNTKPIRMDTGGTD